MRLPTAFRAVFVAAVATVLLGLSAPAFALTQDQCTDKVGGDLSSYCSNVSGDANGWEFVDGGPESEDMGIPGGFVVLVVLAAVAGIAITIWKVSASRDLARKSGMDPNIATGMALLDDNGLSAAYIASSVRNSQAAPAPVAKETAAQRLAELTSLLDGGLITQAEYDTQRAAIINGV